MNWYNTAVFDGCWLQVPATGPQNLPPYPSSAGVPGDGGQFLPRPSVVSQPAPPAQDTLMPQLPAVPTMSMSTTPSAKNTAGGDDVNFDDLARRFEELKKRK